MAERTGWNFWNKNFLRVREQRKIEFLLLFLKLWALRLQKTSYKLTCAPLKKTCILFQVSVLTIRKTPNNLGVWLNDISRICHNSKFRVGTLYFSLTPSMHLSSNKSLASTNHNVRIISVIYFLFFYMIRNICVLYTCSFERYLLRMKLKTLNHGIVIGLGLD